MRKSLSYAIVAAALVSTAMTVPATAQMTPSPGWYGEDYYASCASNHNAPGCFAWTVTTGLFGSVKGAVNWVYQIDAWHRRYFGDDKAACQAAVDAGKQLTGGNYGWCEYVD